MSQLDTVLEHLGASQTFNTEVYDVKDVNPFHDYIVIATAGNPRQLQAVMKKLKSIPLDKDTPFHVEGSDDSPWMLLAIGDTIVHLFLQEAREYYHLEKLWFDLPHWTVSDES